MQKTKYILPFFYLIFIFSFITYESSKFSNILSENSAIQSKEDLQLKTEEISYNYQKSSCQSLFDTSDANADGYLSPEEYATTELDLPFDEVDINGDYSISREEFLSACGQIPRSV